MDSYEEIQMQGLKEDCTNYVGLKINQTSY